jgi:uncharacterized membrane protein
MDFLLLVVVLLTAIPVLYLAVRQFVEYDGYWHIFVAQQDASHSLSWDIRNIAHPPLYLVLLRLVLTLGPSHLAYRAISILSILASLWVMGRIGRKLMMSRFTPLVGALVFGLAVPTIVMACEVRAYAMSVAFILTAYLFFLDIVASEERGSSWRARADFAIAIMLACLSEYFAVFAVRPKDVLMDVRLAGCASGIQ